MRQLVKREQLRPSPSGPSLDFEGFAYAITSCIY